MRNLVFTDHTMQLLSSLLKHRHAINQILYVMNKTKIILKATNLK